MGATASSLADCVLDGDIPGLKTLLVSRPQALKAPIAADQRHQSDCEDASDGVSPSAAEWARQVEEAVHTAVAMEIRSPRELQQLQIALELLLLACPAAWSSRLTGSADVQAAAGGQMLRDGQNNGDWTASHRACVTGNLSFVAFVRQQQVRQGRESLDRGTCRDAFGLLPVDLVPPELLLPREEVAAELATAAGGAKRSSTIATTARERRGAAIRWLRESKAVFESQLVLQQLQQARRRRALARARAKEAAETAGDGPTTPVEEVSEAEPDASTAPGAFFVELAPSQERFASVPSGESLGSVHDHEAPLRVRFCVPRAEIFLQGYFQLVWRAASEPRSEEPRYEPQVLRLRDELRRRMDENPPLAPEQLGSAQGAARRLDDEREDAELGLGAARELRGWFPLSVAHLPEDSVANVLFVACDRNLLHRSVVLSTEGVLLQTPPPRGWSDSDQRYASSDECSEEEEDGDEEEEEEETGFRFVVGGEEFRHPSAELDGKEFADVSELEAFVQRVVAARRLQQTGDKAEKEAEEAEEDDKQHDARPSERTDGHATAKAALGTESADARDDPQPERDASDAA